MDAARTSRPEATSGHHRVRGHGGQDRNGRDGGTITTAVRARPQWSSGGRGASKETNPGGTPSGRQKGGRRAMAEISPPQKVRFTPKPEKIIAALLYLAHKRPNLDHYQAVKLLYLADKEHLNRYGRPITFDTYSALPYGPVGSIALNFLKRNAATMRRFRITGLPFETEKLDKIIYIRSPRAPVDYNLFSRSDLRVLDEIIAEHGDKTFDQLYKRDTFTFCLQKCMDAQSQGDQSRNNGLRRYDRRKSTEEGICR